MAEFIEVEAKLADNTQRPFVRCIFKLDIIVLASPVDANINNLVVITNTGNTYLFNMNMAAFKALVEKAETKKGVATFEDVTGVSPEALSQPTMINGQPPAVYYSSVYPG